MKHFYRQWNGDFTIFIYMFAYLFTMCNSNFHLYLYLRKLGKALHGGYLGYTCTSSYFCTLNFTSKSV